jgi:hypothetical protein
MAYIDDEVAWFIRQESDGVRRDNESEYRQMAARMPTAFRFGNRCTEIQRHPPPE